MFKPVFAAGFWGEIKPPPGIDKYGSVKDGGLVSFASNILKLAVVGAGLFALVNFILAGYAFLAAGGDSQKVGQAWMKIFWSIIGLAFATGSFALAAIFGKLLFGRWDAILSPVIYGPN
ncbi:MAG: hypothetical protein ABID04_01260 [Patescibacteria group bacterium]